MLIDWTHFTLGCHLAGGVLLGLASALLCCSTEHPGHQRHCGWAAARAQAAWAGAARNWACWWRLAFTGWWSVPQPRVDATWGMVVMAGLLVGVGTRYGSGCTSGGVCGL